MADLSKLKASAAKLEADVDTLLGQSTSQADVDAVQASLDAADAKVVAAITPPAV